MSKKKGILFGAIGLCVMLLIWVGGTATSISRENNALEDTLKAELTKHTSYEEMSQLLTAKGYEIKPGSADGTLEATGHKHSVLVYSTWLMVQLKFNAEKKNTAYSIDHASGWF